jgi:hypothetical protein
MKKLPHIAACDVTGGGVSHHTSLISQTNHLEVRTKVQAYHSDMKHKCLIDVCLMYFNRLCIRIDGWPDRTLAARSAATLIGLWRCQE